MSMIRNSSDTNSLPRPSAVLFDWDNTLVNSWAVIHEAMNTTLTHFGKDNWTLEETRQRVRKSMRNSFPVLFGDAWSDAADVFYARYSEIHVSRLEPLPGSQDMLEALHGHGVFMAVVSNKTGEYLRIEATHLGWDRYLENLVGANDAEQDKPAADPVHMALDGSGHQPAGNVWFVGDADIDLECAVNTGCTPILVRETPPEPGEFDRHPPAKYLKNCTELKEFTKLCFE